MTKLTKEQVADYVKNGSIVLKCDTCRGKNTKWIILKRKVVYCSCGGILTKSWKETNELLKKK